MEEKVYGYVPSEMDGTEQEFDGNASLDIPTAYSYKRYLPNVLDQGQYPICVPCSLTAHINWNINVDNNEENDVDHRINVFEIYSIKTNQGDGMSFKEALHYLQHHGVATNEGVNKIEKYALVKSIDALKIALILNGPCVGALPVWNDSGIAEFWSEKTKTRFCGGHAISIVGYNDKGFIIRNSWGNMYGNDGYSVLKYEDFHYFYEIWTIID